MAQIANQDNLIIEISGALSAAAAPKYTVDIVNSSDGAADAIALN